MPRCVSGHSSPSSRPCPWPSARECRVPWPPRSVPARTAPSPARMGPRPDRIGPAARAAARTTRRRRSWRRSSDRSPSSPRFPPGKPCRVRSHSPSGPRAAPAIPTSSPIRHRLEPDPRRASCPRDWRRPWKDISAQYWCVEEGSVQSRRPSSPIACAAIVWLVVSRAGIAAGQTAGIFGVVDGTIMDPQRRPAGQVDVTLHAQLSSWQAETRTNDEGRFAFTGVPAGEYAITVTREGFQTLDQRVVVRSGSVSSLALTLSVGAVAETVHVTGVKGTLDLKSTTTESLVTRDQLEQTPGALRTSGMDVITQFVPGAYMVHDQLHIRGGHQVSWLVDGVPVPNTNIAD